MSGGWGFYVVIIYKMGGRRGEGEVAILVEI